jgi:peptide/nickel transport system permease protein
VVGRRATRVVDSEDGVLTRVVRGLAQAVVTVLLASFLTFVLMSLTPGDPAAIAAGEFATPQTVRTIRLEMGLDQPFVTRYVNFIGDAVQGDLGTSVQLQPGRKVEDLVSQAVPITASLTLVALVFAVLVGLPLGLVAGLRPGSLADRIVAVTSGLLLAVPSFVVGLALVVLLAITIRWFPAIGYSPPEQGVGDWLWHLLLPGITLGLPPAAEIARQLRGAMVDVMEQDYIRTATAKGMSRTSVVAKHAAKNALPPVVTVFGIQIVRVIGGAIIVERIFALNGVGSLAYGAVIRRDLPVVQGLVVVIAAFVVVLNIIVDLLHASLTPRSR